MLKPRSFAAATRVALAALIGVIAVGGHAWHRHDRVSDSASDGGSSCSACCCPGHSLAGRSVVPQDRIDATEPDGSCLACALIALLGSAGPHALQEVVVTDPLAEVASAVIATADNPNAAEHLARGPPTGAQPVSLPAWFGHPA